MIKTSKALQKLFYEYTHLQIGKNEVACPYWMNNLEKGIFGPIGGKGRPDEIVIETNKAAEKEKIDLKKLSKEEIIFFMRAEKIGVDCSGFVFWMLDCFDIELGGNGIADDIPNSRGLFIGARANVKMLTAENVSNYIDSVEKAKIGDMIKTRRGKHIMIITDLGYKDNKLEEIGYAHSSGSNYTLISGVHKGKIKIIQATSPVWEQIWLEKTPESNSYLSNFYPLEGDGIYRLKIFE